jgi:hypothetical protein
LMLTRPCQHAALLGGWQRPADDVKSEDRSSPPSCGLAVAMLMTMKLSY